MPEKINGIDSDRFVNERFATYDNFIDYECMIYTQKNEIGQFEVITSNKNFFDKKFNSR